MPLFSSSKPRQLSPALVKNARTPRHARQQSKPPRGVRLLCCLMLVVFVLHEVILEYYYLASQQDDSRYEVGAAPKLPVEKTQLLPIDAPNLRRSELLLPEFPNPTRAAQVPETRPVVQDKDAMTKQTRSPRYHDKERILQILAEAGIKDVDDETMQKLPSWANVTSLYGTHPRIHGLDQCEQFRSHTNATERMLAVAGTFNTGTNLMLQLLEKNCHIPERTAKYGKRVTGMEWQVPWGKHNPPVNEEFRHTHRERGLEKRHENNTLPVVTLRDPYNWMKAMCQASYSATWKRKKEHCPNLVPNHVDMAAFPEESYNESSTVPVVVRFSKEHRQHHDSLAHMWNHFNGIYLHAKYPRIMVRMEDLVFYAKDVTESLCTCVGGKMNRTNFQYVVDSAKTGGGHKAGLASTSFVGAMIKYGTDKRRFEGYEEADLQFASKTLDRELLEIFGYSNPPTSLVV